VKCCNYDMNHSCPKLLNQRHLAGRAFLIVALAMLLFALGSRTAHAAIFDFTPGAGSVSASYASADGAVKLSISGANPKSVPSGNTFDITINNGIVAWSSSTTVYYYVFDPSKTNWVGGTAPGATFDLSVADGVVAWSTPSAASASCRVYDPARKNWISSGANGAVVGKVKNKGGVVTWTTATTVHYQVYDPTTVSGWKTGSTPNPGDAPFNTSDLATADGVVAWSLNTGSTTSRVYYQIYNPQSGSWVPGSNNNGPTTSLSISNSLLSWNTTGGKLFRGFNGPQGRWEPNSPTPLAYFAVSTNAGNASFYVSFIDMSLAAASWSWNFGDGTPSSTARSPLHRYEAFGRFTATLGINGNPPSFSREIRTDIAPPTGTIAINGGSSFATNRNVTLSLTVSDNSQLATTMRFANEGTNWSDWESFAAAKVWPLVTNTGTRSVSAQFRDVALNTSATVTATIQLDTSPLPIISMAGTNVSESIGTITLTAVLDHTYSRPVAVSYTSSNSTATAGQDFNTASGSLIFPASTLSRTFTVVINNDLLVELNESFFIHFTVVSNAVSGPASEVTILDDDLPVVSFAQANYPVPENDTNGQAVIALHLSAPSGRTVTVQWTATNGTATADIDYLPVTGETVFPPGITNLPFTIPLINDNQDEFSETVNLHLLGAMNALLSANTSATLTILDDDKPVIFFDQATYPIYESNGVSSAVKINIRLSKPYTEAVHVECAVQGITASPGDDYDQPFSNIQLTFQPGSGSGSTNKEITLLVRPDTLREAQETIHLTLTDFAGGSPGPVTTALIVITDDDAPPFMANPVLGSNGQFSATFIGFPGQVFALESSASFSIWTQLFRLTNTTGTLNFSQPIPTNSLSQFFRTRLIL